MKYEIRELTLGGILDQTISIVKNRFGLLMAITFVLLVPVYFFLNVALEPFMHLEPIQTREQANAMNAQLMKALPMLAVTYPLFFLFAMPLTNAAVIHTVAKEYLEQPVTLGGAYQRAFAAYLPLLGTGILFYLVVTLGMFLCIVPGILFALWFCLFMNVIVIEGTGGTDALSRSKKLMKDNMMTAIALSVLIAVISGGISFVGQMVLSGYVRAAVESVVYGVTFIFAAAAFVVFYFSCRCMHERFDLALLAQNIGAEAIDPDVSFDREM